MKRALLAFGLFLFVAIGFNSCKSGEHCPAYGEAPTEQGVDRKG
jgi:hypothetical protein